MAVKIYSVRCPECNASLPIEEGRTQMFCSYCGAKIIVHNENEYIYRHIDEAELTQAETDRLVELKRLEMEEKQREKDEARRKNKVILSIILGAIGVVCMGIGYIGNEYGFLMPGMVCLIILVYMWLVDSAKKNKDDDG